MLNHDELAGICELFGALTREEMANARSEIAFRQGREPGSDERVEEAIAEYSLVEHEELLVTGPTAFPTLPDGAGDLPHILDVPERELDRETLGECVIERLRDEEDSELTREVSYDVEAWAPVDASAIREQERL
jgi:hypothetical protein